MIERKNFNSSKVPRLSEVFPQAVIAGDFIFLSGTGGLDAGGKLISDDFEEQLRQAFQNIQAILEDAGSGLDKIVKTTVFMVSGNDFSLVNKVYSEFFPTNAPARSTPQLMPFPNGIKVSVECIAMK